MRFRTFSTLPGPLQQRRTLWLALACSLGLVLALYLAGGWRPYVSAPGRVPLRHQQPL